MGFRGHIRCKGSGGQRNMHAVCSNEGLVQNCIGLYLIRLNVDLYAFGSILIYIQAEVLVQIWQANIK